MKKTGLLAPSLIAIFVFFACYLIIMSLRNIVAMNKSYQGYEKGETIIATNNLMLDVKSQIKKAVNNDDHIQLFMVGLQLKSLYNSGLISIYDWDDSIRYLKNVMRK